MYNPDKQYRCTIIRGKAQNQMDDLLPFYASVIEKICPCPKDLFDAQFNEELAQNFYQAPFEELEKGHKKTIRNHATEIAGKLFCLYYEVDDCIQMSESCSFLIEHRDQPAFFKNLCLNFQFPNASQKSDTIVERIEDDIKLKPFHFILTLLEHAHKQKEILTKQEIAYYVLNALEVLQGTVIYQEVYDTIIADRKNGVVKDKIAGSYEMQHIKEQLNLLELANLILIENENIHLNTKEESIIKIFKEDSKSEFFDIKKYYTNDGKKHISKKGYQDWALYYGSVRFDYSDLKTNEQALASSTEDKSSEPKEQTKPTTVQIGDRGEEYIYKMEQERVRNYKERFVNKVLLLGKIKGLGYDISSIEAEGENPEFARYIEVKSTIRVTEPEINATWRDTLSLTAKEWTAAKQYKEYYNIYRVFFTPNKTIVYRINDPYTKHLNDELDVYPTMFHVEVRQKNIKTISS